MSFAESGESRVKADRVQRRPRVNKVACARNPGRVTKGCEARAQTELMFRTHGGKRPGAGRKPKGKRPGVSHAARPTHNPQHPVHVTLRIVGSAAGLRRRDTYLAVREATIVTAKRDDFRIIHLSIQHDHLHLIVEAQDRSSLSRGVRGFSISAARQINRSITARGGDMRTGRVIADRYHARPLTSPRAVRNTIAYIRVIRPIQGELLGIPRLAALIYSLSTRTLSAPITGAC